MFSLFFNPIYICVELFTFIYIYDNMKLRMNEICKGIELAYNCNINLYIKDDYPAVNNDKNLFKEFSSPIKQSNNKWSNVILSR